MDDGSQLEGPATILTICKGIKRTEAYTDSNGSFTFEFGSRMSPASSELGDVDTSMSSALTRRSNQRDWRDCELQAALPGYYSESVQLALRVSSVERSDIGRIVLHRHGQVEGLTVSATSALAPEKARKAFDKARDQEKKEKWDEAQQSLQTAVEIYPRYAVAWYELGRVQAQKNDLASARHSFDQALEVDPKYVNPYQGLAELATREGRWQDLVAVTGKWLALNPVNFPDAWFLNSVGNYNVHDLEVAEKAARQGLKVDEEHRIPKLEHLLGMILIQKRDYQEAAEHMKQYLHLVTKPADVEEARKQLAEIARLSASTDVSPVNDRK
jgi:tetratricopeptide (TPR) repeat protein